MKWSVDVSTSNGGSYSAMARRPHMGPDPRVGDHLGPELRPSGATGPSAFQRRPLALRGGSSTFLSGTRRLPHPRSSIP
ncbi:unnamed protein product [Arctogadus glacialis]